MQSSKGRLVGQVGGQPFKADAEMMDIDTQSEFFQYLASDQCDIQKICRLCLSVKIDEELTSLHDEVPSGRIVDLLSSFTSIEVLSDTDLPCRICSECTNQLEQCCKFKRRCEKSDSSLKSVFKGEYVKDEPLDDIEVKIDCEPFDSSDATENFSCLTDPEDITLSISEKKTKDSNIDQVRKKNNTIECESYKSEDTTHGLSFVTSNSENSLISEEKTKDSKKTKGRRKNNYKTKTKYAVKENPFQCHICPEKFSKIKLLLDHIALAHRGDIAGYCVQCKEHFEDPRDLELHASVHEHGPPWKCIKCFKEFISRTALRRHISRHMQHKKHRCERCGKAFSEHFALTRHCRVHTGQTIERQHLCVECGKRFSDAGRLRQHMLCHSEQRPFACPACDKRFRSNRLLASHSRIHDTARPHQCQHCEKRFRHESTCKAHERIHTGERPYVCAACGKTFLQSSNLNLHMRTHSGERPYACSECERCFKSSSSLKTHLRTHTGEKPYSCHLCHKRFARADLRAHLRRHAGERPFPCSACPRRFFTAARLKEHYNVVHAGEKPFECAVCSQRLATKSHLLKHIRSHQKKKVTPSAQKRQLIVLRVTDDTPYATIPENHPIILSNNDSCGEVIISNDCTDITNIASNDMPVSIPLQMVQEDNSLSFNQINNVNLVTVSEATSSMEGASVKLYQLDQSLVQIHSSGGQVTISKITSKMTANFE